jgi:hypothetical protein
MRHRTATQKQQNGEKDSRCKTSYTAAEVMGGRGDEKREAATGTQLDLDARIAAYESKDDYSSRKAHNRRRGRTPKEKRKKEEADEQEQDHEEEDDGEEDESDDESDEKEIKMARKELAARKEIYRQLCERERKNQMRCIECAEQLRADGNDVAQYNARFPSSLFSFVSSFCERSRCGTRYDAAIDKAVTTFGPGGPTVEDFEFVVEMVRYRAEVRWRINEAASRELEEKLEQAKRARIAAEEAEEEAERLVKERHEAEALERERPLGKGAAPVGAGAVQGRREKGRGRRRLGPRLARPLIDARERKRTVTTANDANVDEA